MIEKARSTREAQVKLQELCLPHISVIAYELGVHLDNSKEWIRGRSNRYYRKKERDKIVYPSEFKPVSTRRVVGEAVILERNADWGMVRPVINLTDEESEETVTYTTEKTVSFEESKSMTHGWTFEVSNKVSVEVGGDAYGGKVGIESTTTAGAHGDYTDGLTQGEEKKRIVETSIKVTLPPQSVRIVEQYEEISKIEVPVTDFVTYDISFLVEDWKKYKHGSPLVDNKRRHSLRGSRTYSMLDIHGLDDLKDLLIGVNVDFPKQHRDLLSENQNILAAWEELINPDLLSVKIEGTQTFENASTGQAKISMGDIEEYS